MIRGDRDKNVEWLRENCLGDAEFEELIDVLEHEGRDDLLFLMRCFRLPPFRFDDQIASLIGSAAEVERGLVALEKIYRPIREEHHKRQQILLERNNALNFYQNRLTTGQDNNRCETLIRDTSWELTESSRESLLILLGCAREKPSIPVDKLAQRLKLATVDDVIDLLMILLNRLNASQRAEQKLLRDNRDGKELS